MAAYFQLYPIGSPEPATFIRVDNAICAHFNKKPDDLLYYEGWYDSIGFRLASGKSFEDIEAEFVQLANDFPNHMWDYYHMVEITRFIKDHYSVNAILRSSTPGNLNPSSSNELSPT